MTSFRSRSRHRLRRGRPYRPGTDGGFVLLEAIVAISLITVLMTALTALFVTSIKVTNHQRLSQSAVRLATDVIDQARGMGVGALPTTATDQTIGGTTYHSTYTACTLDTTTGTCTTGVTGALVRFAVTITWPGSDCGSGGCSYSTSVVLSNAADPTFLVAAPTTTTTSTTSTTTTNTTTTSTSSTPTGFEFAVPAHSVPIATNCGHAITLTDDLVQYVAGASAAKNLTFSFISSTLTGIATVSVSGTQLSITQPCTGNVVAGTYQATVSVTDSGLGKTAQSTFAVNIVASVVTT